MDKLIESIDYTNCNIHISSFIKMIDKIILVTNTGYISDDNLSVINSKLVTLCNAIDVEKIKNHDGNRISLETILPATDHLKIICKKYTLGSFSLVSKKINEIMIHKYGEQQIDLYRIHYYLKQISSKTTIKNVNVMFKNKIRQMPMSLEIIMKKQLRNLIGAEKYFKQYSEIFYMSDLKYISNMFIIEGHLCPKLFIPNTICIFCKEIKSFYNLHINCYDRYITNNFNKKIHNEKYNKNKLHNKKIHYDLSYNSSYDEEDEYYGLKQDLSLIEYTLCKHIGSISFNCNYIYPELIYLSLIKQKKYFPVPKMCKSDIVICSNTNMLSTEKNLKKVIKKEPKNKKPLCSTCTYTECDSEGDTKIRKYDHIDHDYIWNCFNKNIIPSKTRNICKKNFLLSPNHINNNISHLTPCHTCSYPRFFHNIDFGK